MSISIKVISAQLSRDTQYFSNMDPYCILKLGGQTQRTKTKQQAGKKPVWNETFRFNNSENALIVIVMDEDNVNDDMVGQGEVNLSKFRNTPMEQDQIVQLYFRGKAAGKVMLRIGGAGIQQPNQQGGNNINQWQANQWGAQQPPNNQWGMQPNQNQWGGQQNSNQWNMQNGANQWGGNPANTNNQWNNQANNTSNQWGNTNINGPGNQWSNPPNPYQTNNNSNQYPNQNNGVNPLINIVPLIPGQIGPSQNSNSQWGQNAMKPNNDNPYPDIPSNINSNKAPSQDPIFQLVQGMTQLIKPNQPGQYPNGQIPQNQNANNGNPYF